MQSFKNSVHHSVTHQINWPTTTKNNDFKGIFISKMNPWTRVWNYTWATVCGHSDKADNHKTFDARLWQTEYKNWTWHSSAVHSSCTAEEFCFKNAILSCWLNTKKSIPAVWKTPLCLLYLTYNQWLLTPGVNSGFCSKQNSSICSFKSTYPPSPTLFLLMRCKTKLKAKTVQRH